jgi:hypothetical protein
MLFLSVVFDVGPVVECCFSQWCLMLVLLLNVVYPLWSYDVVPVVECCFSQWSLMLVLLLNVVSLSGL